MKVIFKDIPNGVLVKSEDIDVEYVVEGKNVKELGTFLADSGNALFPKTKVGVNKYQRYLVCLLEYWKGQRDACEKILSGKWGKVEKLQEYSEAKVEEISIMLKKARDGG